MPITAVIMIFFGIVVLYDTNKHKKDRKPVSRLLIMLIGVFALLYGIVNFIQAAGLIS